MRILGLDIGEQRIRAVEIDSTRKRYEVLEYHERKVSQGQNPFATAAELIQKLKKKPERISILMPPDAVTFRNLQLPIKDKKAIRQAVAFELENEVPFDPEETFLDYSLLSQDKTGSSVHVVATMRKYLMEFLGHLLENGIDPDIITSESWAYRTWMNHAISQKVNQPVILVKIGRKSTSLYVHHHETPHLLRNLKWGGDDITQAIADHYRISIEDAEKAKLDNGFVLSDSNRDTASHEQIEFSQVVESVLALLYHDINQSMLMGKAYTKEPIARIYLSGGTSLLPGIRTYMEDHFRLRVTNLPALSGLSHADVTYSDATDAYFLMAASAGLCALSTEKSNSINLRKDEFAKRGQTGEFRLRIQRGPLLAAGVTLFIMCTSLLVQSNVYETRLKSVSRDLERTAKTFFGTTKTPREIARILKDPEKLRKDVDRVLDRKRNLNRFLTDNKRSPVIFLRELSKAIPAHRTVDLVAIDAGATGSKNYDRDAEQTVSLTFLLADQNDEAPLKGDLGSLLDEIKSSPGKMVETPYPEDRKGEDSKKYRITITGKLKGSVYGS